MTKIASIWHSDAYLRISNMFSMKISTWKKIFFLSLFPNLKTNFSKTFWGEINFFAKIKINKYWFFEQFHLPICYLKVSSPKYCVKTNQFSKFYRTVLKFCQKITFFIFSFFSAFLWYFNVLFNEKKKIEKWRFSTYLVFGIYFQFLPKSHVNTTFVEFLLYFSKNYKMKLSNFIFLKILVFFEN